MEKSVAAAKPELGPQIRHAKELEIGRHMHVTSLGRVFRILAAALVFMAVFNSQGFLDWSLKLPAGPAGDAVLEAAGRWHDLMDAAGATRLRSALREGFRSFRDTGF